MSSVIGLFINVKKYVGVVNGWLKMSLRWGVF